MVQQCYTVVVHIIGMRKHVLNANVQARIAGVMHGLWQFPNYTRREFSTGYGEGYMQDHGIIAKQ
eukprot:12242541-Ditylum_brightwellii.AAC.1